MTVYNKDSKLMDAVMASPQLIPVINRLGVSLGVSDSTIGSICTSAHIDADFFLSIINTFLEKDYFPANPGSTFTLEKTVDYLEKTSRFYQMVQLPNIDRHFSSLMAKSGKENNLQLLQKFFMDMKTHLSECLRYEMEILFPALRNGELPENMDSYAAVHAEVEARIHDLLYFFVVHLRGEYDRNLCTAVVSAIFALERDYEQNNRIRNRILFPMISEKRAEQFKK